MKHIFKTVIATLSFFATESFGVGVPTIKDMSMGGGAIFGKNAMGTIQGNARIELGEWGPLAFFWGGDVKILFPKGADLGVSLGVPLVIQHRNWFLKPFVSLVGGYANIRGNHPFIEAVGGANIGVKELEGIRLYAGWSHMGRSGVILGGLIFLAY